MQRPRTLLQLVCLPALLTVLPCPLGAGERTVAKPVDRQSRPTVGARLMWDSSDELDMLGDLWADVPFRIGDRSSIFVGLFTRTAIEKTTSELTFLVRDLQYDIDVGWRGAISWTGQRPVSFFLGQRGTERVDAEGQPFLRYLGFGLESRGYRRFEEDPFCTQLDCSHQNRWAEWLVSGGPVFDEREIEGDFVVQGDARFWAGPRRSRLLSMLRGDVRIDGFYGDGRFRADVAAGPRLEIPISGGRQFSLFAHYQWSRNPLGIGHSAVLAGIDYSEGAGGRAVGLGAPEIDGIVAAGSGDDDRNSGELRLRMLSPAFATFWHAVFDIDAHVLTADDTDELYYLYFVGLERFVGRHLAGAYFYHRSNHQLSDPNDTVTSINVLEIGAETRGWHRAGRRGLDHGWGTLDGQLRAGYLIDSAFGEDERWHVRGGLRWTLPIGGSRLNPFLLAEAEAGDVEREGYALGLSLSAGWDVQLEYRDDEQYFSVDKDALLFVARYGF